MTRRKLITMSVASAILVTAMGIHAPSVEAKTLSLSSKKVTLSIGKSKTIKVRGAKKVKWKVAWGSKCIRLSNKKKTSVKIIAKKAGSAKIQAKAGNKKMVCKVTIKSAKSRKTTVLNVTKVDKATVKKVHETLSKGNTLKIHMSKGTKSQRINTLDKLRVAVSKYNEYGVLPQFSGPDSTKSYTGWFAGNDLADQYKWGLLLIKDFISSNKNDYLATMKSRAKDLADKESELKNKYKFEDTEYRKIFKEVTGIYYDDKGFPNYEEYAHVNADKNWDTYNYKDGQVTKNSKNELLPDGYYYVTYKIDGKEVTRTKEVETFFEKKDWDSYYYNSAEYLEFKDKIEKEYDAKGEEREKQLEKEIKQREEAGESIDQYTRGVLFDTVRKEIEDEKTEKLIEEEDKRITEYYSKTDNWYFDIDGKQLSFDDITFHYEPLKVDLTAVDTAINTKITSELNIFKKELESQFTGKMEKLLYENKFCDLSSAVQQWWIRQILDGNSKYVTHKYGSDVDEYTSGGGEYGLKRLYQKKWGWTRGSYYNSAETTIYNLFCLEFNRISCDECNEYNRTFLVVKLTNSEGQTIYAKIKYGAIVGEYTAMPYSCIKHEKSKNKGIKYSSEPNFKYN